MSELDIFKILFLALLHAHIWFSWAKSDSSNAKLGIPILSIKRVIPFLIPMTLTILSIVVIEYPVPRDWFWRILVDVVAVGIIIYFRLSLVQKNTPSK